MNALLLVALAASGTAHAEYKFLGYAWAQEDLPLQWYITDEVEESLENASYYSYDSDGDGVEDTPYEGAHDYQVRMLQTSFENWYEAAPCAEIDDEYMGVDEGNEGSARDGMNKIYFGDPNDEEGTGVNGWATYRGTGEYLFSVDDEFIYRMYDVDITFNDNVDWGVTEEVEESCGGGTRAIEPTATHEIGHMWGLAHSCEEGETCSDEDMADATMYWSGSGCDLSRTSPNSWDAGTLNALYGPYATFSSSDDRFGGVPLTVAFEIEADEDEEITGVEWNFGDGSTSTELAPEHTYEQEGQFTVSVEIGGYSDTCGDWTYTYRERAYVIACGEPEPGISEVGGTYPGLFTYVQEDDYTYRMVNRTDTSVYGCIDTVVWEVYDASGDVVQEYHAWSPLVEFDDEGPWRIVLNVGGPGGMAAAEIELEAGPMATGCTALPSPLSPAGAGLAGLLALSGAGLVSARRRRLPR